VRSTGGCFEALTSPHEASNGRGGLPLGTRMATARPAVRREEVPGNGEGEVERAGPPGSDSPTPRTTTSAGPPHPAMEPLRRRQAALDGRCSRQARMPRHLPSRSLLLRAATALPAFHGFLPAPEGVPSSSISPARSMPRSEEKWGTNRSLPCCLMDGCDLSFILLTLPQFFEYSAFFSWFA
jgi:hypothetical protein